MRKVRHIRQQWSRIKLRERRRHHRHKLAWRARIAELSPPVAEATTEGADANAGADADATVTTTPASKTQATHQPVQTTRRAPRIVYPLLKKPMTRKAINKKLHQIKNRRILPHAIKSRLHLTLKANKWGRFPRTRRACRFLWMQAQGSPTDGDSVLQIIIMPINSPWKRRVFISEKLPKLACVILVACDSLPECLELFQSIRHFCWVVC